MISQGRTVTEVAEQWQVSRQTLHAWLARYDAEGLDGLPGVRVALRVGPRLVSVEYCWPSVQGVD